jgi:hypothetical protein
MVREGAPTTSLFALAKDVDADLRRHDGNRGWRVGFNGGWYNNGPRRLLGRFSPWRSVSSRVLRAIKSLA